MQNQPQRIPSQGSPGELNQILQPPEVFAAKLNKDSENAATDYKSRFRIY